MALRKSAAQLCRSVSESTVISRASPLASSHVRRGSRLFATAHVPPVPQNATGSKGPTAIVFLNMGGPSTVDEVGDFLRRLFVGGPCEGLSQCALILSAIGDSSKTEI